MIVTHQYRNSDFTRMVDMENAVKFRDGFIVDGLRGASFYGLFGYNDIISNLKEVGFSRVEYELNDGTAFITAEK